jgi:hypothetical protein
MASFEYEGKEIRVIPPREITLGDLQFMRDHFDIPGQVELEQGMGDMEPGAWRALFVASIRQVQPSVDPKTAALDHVAVLPVLLALNEELAAEQEKRDAAGKADKRNRPTKRSKSSLARSGASSSA